MKRKLLIWLVAALLCASLPGIAGAAEEPQFRMSVTADGDEITAVISATDLTDLYGFELQVAYDPLRMKFEKAESAFQGFSVPPIVKGGLVTLSHTKVGPVAGLNGDAELATLRFTRTGGGTAAFALESVSLVDSDVRMNSFAPQLVATVEDERPSVELSDIAGHWAEANILEALELGWVTGYSDGTFQPDRAVNRAEFAAMLARALRLEAGGEPPFTDAAQLPAWSRPYIAAAAEAGIVTGYNDGAFRADRLINRAEMTAMIARAGKLEAAEGGVPAFTDTKEIAAWAQPYVKAAADAGLVQGKGGNRFAPEASATRAEAATMILNLLRSGLWQ